MARKKKEIKQDNFYTIRYWMPEKLHLGGTKLLVYGFLYSYSVNEKSKGYYYGGQGVMSRATGCSTRQLPRVLSSLEDIGLIEIQKAILENGLERNYYRVAIDPLEAIATDNTPDIRIDLCTMEGTHKEWIGCISEDPNKMEVARVF